MQYLQYLYGFHNYGYISYITIVAGYIPTNMEVLTIVVLLNNPNCTINRWSSLRWPQPVAGGNQGGPMDPVNPVVAGRGPSLYLIQIGLQLLMSLGFCRLKLIGVNKFRHSKVVIVLGHLSWRCTRANFTKHIGNLLFLTQHSKKMS